MEATGAIEERVRFRSDGLELEGILAYPGEDEPTSRWLLLAPHPHMGGRMDNNVIRHLARRAAETGCATLRFNYRGVGASDIQLAAGESLYDHWGEMERTQRYEELLPDARAAAGFLASQAPSARRNVVIGYSLGAILAGMTAAHERFTHLVAIAPPVARVSLEVLHDLTLPKLSVCGDRDAFCPPAVFAGEFERVPEPKQVRLLEGCDHFFRGREEAIFEEVSGWLDHARQGVSSSGAGRFSST